MMSPEFNFARAEDKDSTSEARINQLAEVYLAKARTNGASDVAIEAIQTHFKNVNANIRPQFGPHKKPGGARKLNSSEREGARAGTGLALPRLRSDGG
jgi:hypothetical protein